MNYYHVKEVDLSYEEALEKVTAELKEVGFGVLTEIDIKETLKKKLDVDVKRQKILGACNPNFANKALQVEPHIAVLLPCNVVVRENENGKIEVSAMNPLEAMKTIGNDDLNEIASEVNSRVKSVIEKL